MNRRLNWPLTLTLLRVLLVPVFLGLIIVASQARGIGAAHLQQQRRCAALIVFGIMALTDVLDGFLARRFHQTTRLGALLDPSADKLLLSASLLLLSIHRYAPDGFVIPWPVVLGAYLKDLGVLIGALVIFARLGKVQITARWPGKICTLIQLTLVLATLLSPEFFHAGPTFAIRFFWALWWITVWITALAAADYARQGALQLRVAITQQIRL